jgi:hypothetical protein
MVESTHRIGAFGGMNFLICNRRPDLTLRALLSESSQTCQVCYATLITSGLLVIQAESRESPLTDCEPGHFYV